MSDAELGERLAARALELVDVSSESRQEARLGEHVRHILEAGGVPVNDLGDTCLRAGPGAGLLLAGHLDTVPAQGNFPGRRDANRVHGLGASDMKGALAVMLELALAGAPFDVLFFGREELPAAHSALAPLLGRERLEYELVVMMEPTGNELHAGCLGNLNATWTFNGRSGHSARPWDAENAIHAAARGVAALAANEREEHVFDGLPFYEVASVTRISGGIADNVIPELAECHVNYRFAPGRSPEEAAARLRELCPGGELRIDSLAPSGPVAVGNPHARRLIETGRLTVAPKQAWTPVAEFAAAGLDAVNFGPGEPGQAHRRDESVEIAALVRSYHVLEAFAA
ncbi:MAG TPA: succinyl-diaminopimelate desuccinylase [Solirubrobacteraceae bacterium]|jgi:succinyl-diaminopimelate desuccinylase|nr:succinyl-diaminopimelate desuccinylase [Solirubrobacteraceae bacterium]